MEPLQQNLETMEIPTAILAIYQKNQKLQEVMVPEIMVLPQRNQRRLEIRRTQKHPQTQERSRKKTQSPRRIKANLLRIKNQKNLEHPLLTITVRTLPKMHQVKTNNETSVNGALS